MLKEDHVNVVMHGHEPLLPEMLYVASMDPEAHQGGPEQRRQGHPAGRHVLLGQRILMRHGVPVVGNYLHQELAIITGAVDAMVVDVQCEMQALENVVKCYHTKLITTDDRAKIRWRSMQSPSTSTMPWTWPKRSS